MNVYIILLCISTVFNAILAWMLVWEECRHRAERNGEEPPRFRFRKRKQEDDVPLVEYDIDDDVE